MRAWIDARWIALFLILFNGVCLLAPTGTPWPFWSRDLFFIWGGATRIAMGQIAHQDFTSPVGFVFFWPAAQFVKMHFTADRAFAISFFLFNFFGIASALFFTRGETDRRLRLLVLLATFATLGSLIDNQYGLMSGFVFGQQYLEGTFYSSYRPLSAGFLGLILFRVFYQPPVPALSRDITDGIALGIGAVILFLIKSNYALLGMLPAVAMFALFPARRPLLAVAAMTGLIFLSGLEISHHYVSGYLQDIYGAVKTHSRVDLKHYLPHYLTSVSGLLFIFIMGLASYIVWKSECRDKWRYQTILIVCLVSNILTTQYDTCGPNLAAYLAALPAIGQWLRRKVLAPADVRPPTPYLLYAVIAVGLVAARFEINAVSLYNYAYTSMMGQSVSLASLRDSDPVADYHIVPRLAAFKPYYATCMKEHSNYDYCEQHFLSASKAQHDANSISYVRYVQSAVALLQAATRHEIVHDLLVLDFVNPFDSLMGITPAKALPLWLDGTTLSPSCYPSPENFLSRVSYVLEPLYPLLTLYVGDLKNIYDPYLRKNFTVTDSNSEFILWKRSRAPETEATHYHCEPRS